jgi:hypothetical protein
MPGSAAVVDLQLQLLLLLGFKVVSSGHHLLQGCQLGGFSP